MENQLEELNNIQKQITNMRERHNNNLQVINDSERWQVVDGYDNYSVSTFERIRNDETNKILKQGTDDNGYYRIGLYINKDKQKRVSIHRLVAVAFIANPLNKPFVDHMDNNRKNNDVSNLRWATKSENGMNMSKKKSNTSGITGVFWNKGHNKWQAQITIDGFKKNLGCFNTIEEAKESRIKAVNELFGEFAHFSEKI
jgi:hypothetical protein